MSDHKTESGRKTGMNVDTELVRELASLLTDSDLTEIEVEDGDRKIRVARSGGTVAYMAAPAAPAAAPPAAPPPSAEATAAATLADNNANAMKSPMVGTAYLAAEPGAEPFVKVGDTVKQGDTVLIVEAMKVMNPIHADRAGTITAILVENAQPIEYDQPLVVIA